MPKILVVDDSATVRNEVSNFLQAQSIEVTTAIDGKDGLDKLRTDSEIALVISDVNMPNLDGLSMVERMRNELRHRAPVIMLTTESDPKMKERGKAAGVKGWIVKPFNGPAVLPGLKRLLA